MALNSLKDLPLPILLDVLKPKFLSFITHELEYLIKTLFVLLVLEESFLP